MYVHINDTSNNDNNNNDNDDNETAPGSFQEPPRPWR